MLVPSCLPAARSRCSYCCCCSTPCSCFIIAILVCMADWQFWLAGSPSFTMTRLQLTMLMYTWGGTRISVAATEVSMYPAYLVECLTGRSGVGVKGRLPRLPSEVGQTGSGWKEIQKSHRARSLFSKIEIENLDVEKCVEIV